MRKTIFTCLLTIAVSLLIGSGQLFAQATLMHSYDFEDGTANDGTGTVNGTLQGTSISIANGLCTVTGATTSTSGYVEFDGAALALNTYSAITLEAYVESANAANSGYTMLAYFGDAANAGKNCFWVQPTRGGGTNSRIETNNGTTTKTAEKAGVEIDDGNIHYVVAILSPDYLTYYLDGVVVAQTATGSADYISNLNTTFACMFKGVWNDNNYNASVDAFNIYDGVMDQTTIENNAIAYGVLDPSKTALLTDLSVGGVNLLPAFDPNVTEYVVEIPADSTQLTVSATPKWTGTVAGDGAIDVSSGSATATVTVTSEDLSVTKDYMVYFTTVAADCFTPLYDNLTNIVSDPEITDVTNFTAWGSRYLNVNPAYTYCGLTSGMSNGNCSGSFDVPLTGIIKPNTTYRIRAMVYGLDGTCQIGVWGVQGSDITFPSTIIDGWEEIDTTFTTGATFANATSQGMFFNTCSRTATIAYIDNWELYELPKKVAYVTEDKLMDNGAYQPDNDPIVKMLKRDPNIDVDVMTVANNAVIDLTGYDVVIAQEPFSSSGAIWKPGGSLGLENIPCPFIYNKIYALRNGKAVTMSPDAAAVDPGFLPYLAVDSANQSNPLFSGITFAGDSVLMFNSGANDTGSPGAKAMQYLRGLSMSDSTTLLGMIKGAVSSGDTSICVNDIPAGTILGTQDTLKHRMIALGQNFGAICKESNMTTDNLTLWRNAVYILAGWTPPTTPVNKAVAYVTEDKTMDSSNQPGNDPVVQMLQTVPNIDLDVMTVANNAVVDLSAYDVVVAQEPFSSSGAVWKPGGTLGLENIPAPFVYNKVYALRNGKAVTMSPDAVAVDPGSASLTYITVDAANQSNPLFTGISFTGDSVMLFNGGATDGGADGTKVMQYLRGLSVSDTTTLLGMISTTEAPADTFICLNDIPAGTVLGTQDTVAHRMIAISQNYGAVCKDGNMTEANYTLWRNAVCILAGVPIPAGAVDNSVEATITADAGMLNSNGNNYELTLPAGSTSVGLTVDVTKGGEAVVPTIDGLADASDNAYEVTVYTPLGMGSVVFNVAVHVQSPDAEIMFLSSDGNGVLASARDYNVNPMMALKDAGYSVTFAKKGSLGGEAQPRDTFDYSPYAAMVIAPGESSSNILVYAQDGYQVPCVSMQPDAPRKTKWGWCTTDGDDNVEMNVTKIYDNVDSIKMRITNADHWITRDYQEGDLVQWNDGAPGDPDWSGKEIKTYDLSITNSMAIPLGRIAADGTSLTSWWAVPDGSSVNTRYKDASNTTQNKTDVLANRVVILNVYSDGLLYATPDGATMLINSLKWAMKDTVEVGVFKPAIKSGLVFTGPGYIKVKVDAPSMVTIYSIDGKVVATKAVESTLTIPSSKGAYIVKVGNSATKVMVTK